MDSLLEELKEYLRIDGDDENRSLLTFIESAKNTLINSGVQLPKDFYEVDEDGEDKYPLHRLAVMILSSHYYENRQVSASKVQNQVPFSVQTMILQLKWVKIDEPNTI